MATAATATPAASGAHTGGYGAGDAPGEGVDDEAHHRPPEAPSGAAPSRKRQRRAAAPAPRRVQPPRPGKEAHAQGEAAAAQQQGKGGGGGGGSGDGSGESGGARALLHAAFPLGYVPPLPPQQPPRPGRAPLVTQAPLWRAYAHYVAPPAAPQRSLLARERALPPAAFVAPRAIAVVRVPLTPKEAAAADAADAARAAARGEAAARAAAREAAEAMRKERTLSQEFKRLFTGLSFPEPPAAAAASHGPSPGASAPSGAAPPPRRAASAQTAASPPRGRGLRAPGRQSALLDLAAVAAAALEPSGDSSGGGALASAGKKRGRTDPAPAARPRKAAKAGASSSKTAPLQRTGSSQATSSGASLPPAAPAPKAARKAPPKPPRDAIPAAAGAAAGRAKPQQPPGAKRPGSAPARPSPVPAAAGRQAAASASLQAAPSRAAPSGQQSDGGAGRSTKGSATPQAAQNAGGASGRAPRAPARKAASKPRRGGASGNGRATGGRPPSGAGAAAPRATAFQTAQQQGSGPLPPSFTSPAAVSVLRQGSVTLVNAGPSGPPPPFLQLPGIPAGFLDPSGAQAGRGRAPAEAVGAPGPAASSPPAPRLLPLPSREMSGAFLFEPFTPGSTAGLESAAGAGAFGSPADGGLGAWGNASALLPVGGLLDLSSPGQRQLLAELQPGWEYLEAYRHFVGFDTLPAEAAAAGAAGMLPLPAGAPSGQEAAAAVTAAQDEPLAALEAARVGQGRGRGRPGRGGGRYQRRGGGAAGGGHRGGVAGAAHAPQVPPQGAVRREPVVEQQLQQRLGLQTAGPSAGEAAGGAAAPPLEPPGTVGILLQSVAPAAEIAAQDGALMALLRAQQPQEAAWRPRLQELAPGGGSGHLRCPCGMDAAGAAPPAVRCVCCGVVQHTACVALPAVAREQRLGGAAAGAMAADGPGASAAPAAAGQGAASGGCKEGACSGALSRPPTFDIVDVAAAAGEVRLGTAVGSALGPAAGGASPLVAARFHVCPCLLTAFKPPRRPSQPPRWPRAIPCCAPQPRRWSPTGRAPRAPRRRLTSLAAITPARCAGGRRQGCGDDIQPGPQQRRRWLLFSHAAPAGCRPLAAQALTQASLLCFAVPSSARAELADPFWAILPPLLAPPRTLRPCTTPSAGADGDAAEVPGLQALSVDFTLPADAQLLAALDLMPGVGSDGGAGQQGPRPASRCDVIVACVKLGADEPSCRLRWPAHALLKARRRGRGPGARARAAAWRMPRSLFATAQPVFGAVYLCWPAADCTPDRPPPSPPHLSLPSPPSQVNNAVIDMPWAPSRACGARPHERAPWAVVTPKLRPGGPNKIVLAGAEAGANFAIAVALARRRSIPEVEQLMAPPLGPADALHRVKGLLAEPLAAPLAPPVWRGPTASGGEASGPGGGGVSREAADAADALPPVPLMQARGGGVWGGEAAAAPRRCACTVFQPLAPHSSASLSSCHPCPSISPSPCAGDRVGARPATRRAHRRARPLPQRARAAAL
jgi:hypothetical protein